MATDFKPDDQVLLPDGHIGTVVYIAPDGRVAVETPWSAPWIQFSPDELVMVCEATP